MSVSIKQAVTPKEMKAFVKLRCDLYRHCKQAVPFLFDDELSTLSATKNPAFEYCEAAYFMAYRDGQAVGRIAAMINRRANERWNRKTVRFGWFDFVDDRKVSAALIRTVEQWGAERGMTEIAGPFGFDDMDREGMLVEGFDRLATMYINYNYAYYPKHMEAMGGFRKDNDYLEYRIRVPEVTPPKFAKLAAMIEQRYNLHIHKFTRRELVDEGKGRVLFDILNTTYDNLYGFARLSDKQIDKLVNDYMRMADLNLVTAVVDANDNNRMVGFGVSFPSFSRALQHTRDGHLLPFGWWHMLRTIKWHTTDTVDLLLIGVLPEYRAKGANALIFNDLISRFRDYGFKWAEAMPQMETNKGVLSQWQYLEAENHRRHRIYVKDIK